MTNSLFRNVIGPATLVVVATTLGLLTSTDSGTAHTYPLTIGNLAYCNQLPADFPVAKAFVDADLAGDPNCTAPDPVPPDSAVDFSLSFGLGEGSSFFGSEILLGFSDDHFMAADADIPDGTKVGGLSNTLLASILNGPCNTPVPLEFILYESTVDDANADGVADESNTVDPLPEGSPNRFEPLVNDADDDGFADADSPLFTQYPSFYNTLFDPDLDYPGGPNGPIPPVAPLNRYSAATKVPPGIGDWLPINFVQFAPGALAAFDSDPDNAVHPYGRFARTSVPAGTVGHDAYIMSVSFLADPTELQPTSSPLSGLCSIQGRLMWLGTTPGSQVRGRTPPANTGIDGSGSHAYPFYSFSLRDADEDGFENQIDTCPYDENTDDPRITTGADFDNIDPACDQGTGGNSADVDGDGFANISDNCPQVANPDQAETEKAGTTYVVAAPDGGPKWDGIGDACDINPSTADGHFITSLLAPVICIANDPPPAGCGELGDTDIDGDGFSDVIEMFITTDPIENCSKTSSQNAWGPDFNNDTRVTIADVLLLKSPFGSQSGQPAYSSRFDLNADGRITIADVLKMKDPFGTNCVSLFPSP